MSMTRRSSKKNSSAEDSVTKETLEELLKNTSNELKNAIEKLLGDTAEDLKQAWKDERVRSQMSIRRMPSKTLVEERVDTPKSYTSGFLKRSTTPAKMPEFAWKQFVRPGGKRDMVLGTIFKGVEKTGAALSTGAHKTGGFLSRSTSTIRGAASDTVQAASNTVRAARTTVAEVATTTKSAVGGIVTRMTSQDEQNLDHHLDQQSLLSQSPRSPRDSDEDYILSSTSSADSSNIRSNARRKKAGSYSAVPSDPRMKRSGSMSTVDAPKKPGRRAADTKLEGWESGSEESEDLSSYHHKCRALGKIVHGKAFEVVISCLILLSAMLIGIETDYMARNPHQHIPIGFRITDIVVCVCFLIEIFMRLCAMGCGFFTGKSYAINIFDFVCVFAQVVELIMSPLGVKYVDFLAYIRIFRLLRLFRITYLFKETTEVRKIVVSITSSFRPLFWTLVVIICVVYIVGVFLTQLVTSVKMGNKITEEDDELEDFFGSLPRSIMSLYKTVSEGIHWQELVLPLEQHFNWTIINILFSFYMAFMIFVMMNVITGHIVECAIEVAEDDKKRQLLKDMRRVFEAIGERGKITWDHFKDHLQHEEETKNFLKEIDIDVYEAISLFSLLDKDHTNEILTEDLVEGCRRLRGPAKVSHVMRFMEEWQQHADYVEKAMEGIIDYLSRGPEMVHDVSEFTHGEEALQDFQEETSIVAGPPLEEPHSSDTGKTPKESLSG